jgi:hypothetical protein
MRETRGVGPFVSLLRTYVLRSTYNYINSRGFLTVDSHFQIKFKTNDEWLISVEERTKRFTSSHLFIIIDSTSISKPSFSPPVINNNETK